MRITIHFIGLVLLVWGSCISKKAIAGMQDDERHHVVVVLDRSRSMYGEGRSLEQLFTSELPRVLFDQDTIAGGRPLFDASHGDVLSIVSFGLSNDFGTFIQTEEGGMRYGFSYEEQANRETLLETWETIGQNYDAFFSKGWSVISASLPLSVAYLKSEAHSIHRTFFVLVSDYKYNLSGNPSLEMQEIVQRRFILNAEGAIKKVNDVLEGYSIEEIGGSGITKGDIKVRFFELFPRTKLFSIESVLEFDNTGMFFNRVPNGYASTFTLSPKDTSGSYVEKIEAIVRRDDLEIGVAFQAKGPIQGEESISLEIPDSLSAMVSEVSLKFWVHLKDGLYDAHVMHPNGAHQRNSEAVHRLLPVVLEPDMNLLLLIPLPDWMLSVAFFVGAKSQVKAVRLWNIIFGCLLFGLVIFGVRLFIERDEVKDPLKFVVE